MIIDNLSQIQKVNDYLFNLILILILITYLWIIIRSFFISFQIGLLAIIIGGFLIILINKHRDKFKRPFTFLLAIIPLYFMTFLSNELFYSIFSNNKPIQITFETLSKGKYPESLYINLDSHVKKISKLFSLSNRDEINTNIAYYPLQPFVEPKNQNNPQELLLIEITNPNLIVNKSDLNIEYNSGMIIKSSTMLTYGEREKLKSLFPHNNINKILIFESGKSPHNKIVMIILYLLLSLGSLTLIVYSIKPNKENVV
jgi:hypothetical protein